MIFLVLVLEIFSLLVPLCTARSGGIDMRTPAAIADESPWKPFMTGVRVSSWDGPRQLFVLQIASLETVYKTVGPFILEDHRDFAAKDCYLRSDSASLSKNLREIGKLMSHMLKPFEGPTVKPQSKLKPGPEAKPTILTERFVGLVPGLKASPFSCEIAWPTGTETTLRADLAAFWPTGTDIALEGNIRVNGCHQTCLTAAHMIWRVSSQELFVPGDYSLQTAKGEIKGRDACFSISDGEFKPVKLQTPIHPGLGELQVPAPTAPVMMMGSANQNPFGKKDMFSYLSRMLLQIMPAAVVAGPVKQGLPPENFRGKVAYAYYSKPITYPAPFMKYSLEETFNRELFCEKCR